MPAAAWKISPAMCVEEAKPAEPKLNLSGCALASGDELLERIRRQILADGGYAVRAARDRNGNEVGDRIIAGLADVRPDDEDAARREQPRITVGLGACDGLSTDRASGTAPVFDDDRLAEAGAHSVGEEAGDGVRIAACWERNHKFDGPCFRPGVLRDGGFMAGGEAAAMQSAPATRVVENNAFIAHCHPAFFTSPACSRT